VERRKIMKIAGYNSSMRDVRPQQLFGELQRRADRISDDALEVLRTVATNVRFFEHALFPPDWMKSSKRARRLLSDNRYRYRFLILLLTKQTTLEDRLFVLANWFYQEGVCQPKELLGERFNQYRKAALRGVPLATLRHAFIVDIWAQYFERLLRDRRDSLDLRQEGYEEKAIAAATGKQSAVSAACAWLAAGSTVTSSALANAHSRIFSRLRRTNPDLPESKNRRHPKVS
jgi:hypothetical protein